MNPKLFSHKLKKNRGKVIYHYGSMFWFLLHITSTVKSVIFVACKSNPWKSKPCAYANMLNKAPLDTATIIGHMIEWALNRASR